MISNSCAQAMPRNSCTLWEQLEGLMCTDILVLVNELVVMAILMVSADHPGYIPSDNMPTCDWSTSMTSHNIVCLVLVSVSWNVFSCHPVYDIMNGYHNNMQLTWQLVATSNSVLQACTSSSCAVTIATGIGSISSITSSFSNDFKFCTIIHVIWLAVFIL